MAVMRKRRKPIVSRPESARHGVMTMRVRESVAAASYHLGVAALRLDASEHGGASSLTMARNCGEGVRCLSCRYVIELHARISELSDELREVLSKWA
jgi:hypothetical protein